MQTTWIAEGTVISQLTNTTDTFNVLWDRVQNTYPGIGPALNFALPGEYDDGTQKYQGTWSQQAALDRNWRYADCRFLRYNGSLTTRNLSVSRALLGDTSLTFNSRLQKFVSVSINPLGLGVFAADPAYTSDLQSLLEVSVLSYCPSRYVQDYELKPNIQYSLLGANEQARAPVPGWYRTAYQGLSLSSPTGGSAGPVPQYNGFPCNPLSKLAVTGAAFGPVAERAINSTWNLQSRDINNQQLIRSYFHVIFPFTVTSEALQQFSQSRFLRATNAAQFGYGF